MRIYCHRRLAFEPLEARRVLATLAINAGGPAIGDYLADQYFSGGGTFGPNNSQISPIDLSGAVDPAPADVYKTERTGNGGSSGAFSYTIPGLIAGGAYTLRLHFAEIYFEGANARVFDVAINGASPPALDDYDVFVASGDQGAAAERVVIEQLGVTARPDGTLRLDFTPSVNNAKLSALELIGDFADPPGPDPGLVWTPAADATLPVFEAQGAAVGDRLYVMGGFFNSGLDVTRQTHAYDPAADLWTRVADAPVELTHGAHAVDGDKLYVLGGFEGTHPGGSTDAVWVYDTALDTWTPGPSLPGDRGGGGAALVGRQLHFFGGATRTEGMTDYVDRADHWVLDLGATDSLDDDATIWTALADMPNPRNHMAGAAIDGVVYAIGGQLGGNEGSGNQDDLQAYDPSTDQWTQLADLPIPLGHITASTVVVGGKLVVIAGVTQQSAQSDRVFSYDPFTDVWSELTALPAKRQSPVAGLVGDRLIVTTGSDAGIHDDTWVADVSTAPRVLFVRGADRSGGFLEANNDAARTEQLADINNLATNGGNHGWGELRQTLEGAGFVVEQLSESLEAGAPATGQTAGRQIDFERMDLSRFDTIVLGSNNAVYGTAAVDAIEAYIRGGGSALFISDANFGSDWADASDSDQQFLDRFGLVMHQDQGTYSLTRGAGDFDAPTHPILSGVDQFDGEGVTPIEVGVLTQGVSATIIAGAKNSTRLNQPPFGGQNQGPTRPSNGAIDAALVAVTADRGKIAGHFDRNTFFNLNGAGTSINRFDNKQYTLNLFGWLVGAFDPLPGDYDGSGLVDQLDYDVWRNAYGAVGAQAADGNGDGRVDAADYTVWRDNLGARRPDVDLTLPAFAAAPALQAAFAGLPPAQGVSVPSSDRPQAAAATPAAAGIDLLLLEGSWAEASDRRTLGNQELRDPYAAAAERAPLSEQTVGPLGGAIDAALELF
ncbi:Kelch repeat-containing protein [Pirellulimonas nuda]|uniref:Kelch repeat-containing protein n=1 Tax=Pirellulimonas nuda TaxID=2528009 RepID=UPI0018D331AA|nr:malectin domain-containing carbohydrate-binding protein [Pirellulimonas nuda]